MIDIRKKYETLKRNIAYHAEKYYSEDEESEITDFEYDMLKMSLKSLEKEHPELLENDK